MLFTQWEHEVASNAESIVFPDGCQDILLIEDSFSNPSIKITDWDDRSRCVQLEQGQRISGFRLRPGLAVNSKDITWLEPNPAAIKSFVENLAAVNYESIELVHEVTDPHTSTQTVARRAGVSTRTLQRRFKKLGLPKPEYWRLLSRARLAANALTNEVSLVEIAIAYGYSDQSHMTRDFKRWFGLSPAQLRREPALLHEICQLGLGNWTTEQISIR